MIRRNFISLSIAGFLAPWFHWKKRSLTDECVIIQATVDRTGDVVLDEPCTIKDGMLISVMIDPDMIKIPVGRQLHGVIMHDHKPSQFNQRKQTDAPP